MEEGNKRGDAYLRAREVKIRQRLMLRGGGGGGGGGGMGDLFQRGEMEEGMGDLFQPGGKVGWGESGDCQFGS